MAKATIPFSLRTMTATADRRDATRFALASVLLEIKDGKFKATSTNSKVLAVVTGLTDKDVDGEALIPAKEWGKIFSCLKAEKSDVEVEINGTLTKFTRRSRNGKLPLLPALQSEVSHAEGRFPPINDILKQAKKDGAAPSAKRFAISVKELKSILEVFASIVPKDDDAIYFEVPEQGDVGKPIHVHGRGDDGLEIEGVIMPLARR